MPPTPRSPRSPRSLPPRTRLTRLLLPSLRQLRPPLRLPSLGVQPPRSPWSLRLWLRCPPLSSSPLPFLPPLPQPLPPESPHNSPPPSLPLQPPRPERSHLPPSRPTSLPPRVHRPHFLSRVHSRPRSPWSLQRVPRLRPPHDSLAPCSWWCQSAPLPRLCSRRVQLPRPPLNCSPPRARYLSPGRCSLSPLPPRVRPINSTCPSSLSPWWPSWMARSLSSAPSASAISPCLTRQPS